MLSPSPPPPSPASPSVFCIRTHMDKTTNITRTFFLHSRVRHERQTSRSYSRRLNRCRRAGNRGEQLRPATCAALLLTAAGLSRARGRRTGSHARRASAAAVRTSQLLGQSQDKGQRLRSKRGETRNTIAIRRSRSHCRPMLAAADSPAAGIVSRGTGRTRPHAQTPPTRSASSASPEAYPRVPNLWPRLELAGRAVHC